MKLNENVEELHDRVRDGAVFIYPTDTTYGIGCSIEHENAVEKVFTLKGRDPDKPVPVLLTEEQIRARVNWSYEEDRATSVFWPGPLTLVMDVMDPQEYVPGVIRDGKVGFRIPDLRGLREFLEEVGPIVGTSANISGQEAPNELKQIHPELINSVDFVLGDHTGTGTSSTVAGWDQAKGEWLIHREGAITREDLEAT